MLLAALPPEQLDAIILDGELVALTPETITDKRTLRLHLDEVRAQGYAFSRHAIQPGVGIIGAALPKGPFGRVFAVGVAGYVADLEAKEDQIVSELRTMVRWLADS